MSSTKRTTLSTIALFLVAFFVTLMVTNCSSDNDYYLSKKQSIEVAVHVDSLQHSLEEWKGVLQGIYFLETSHRDSVLIDAQIAIANERIDQYNTFVDRMHDDIVGEYNLKPMWRIPIR